MIKKIVGISIAAAVIVLGLFSTKMFEHVGNDQFLVIQHPVSGKLDTYFQGGTYPQYFGEAEKFPRSYHLWFSQLNERGSAKDESLGIHFSDSGAAHISGGVQIDFPTDKDALEDLYKTYHTSERVIAELVRPLLEKAAYMTGPLMTTVESASARRNNIPTLIEDQAALGIYETSVTYQKQTDPISGKEAVVAVTTIATDPKTAKTLRQEESPLVRFKLHLYNLTIDQINYEPNAQAQIDAIQKNNMAIQTSIADARKSEQEVVTTQSKGMAAAAEAEWKQKALSATAQALAEQEKSVATTKADQEAKVATTKAQQERDVAQLNLEAEKLNAEAILAKSTAEAQGQKLMMESNGALEQKLAALVKIAEAQAQALSNYKGNLVPSVVMGGKEGFGGNANADLISTLLTTKLAESAKALGVDLSLPTGAQASK